MSDQESDAFARFARRMARIEAEVPDPPQLQVSLPSTSHPRSSRSTHSLAIPMLLTIGVIGMATLSRLDSSSLPPTSSGSSASVVESSTGAQPTIVCGRPSASDCEEAIQVARVAGADQLDEVGAIVVEDPCPPDFVCDRVYPFMAAVVFVRTGSAATVIRSYMVVGDSGPESAIGSAEPLPPHVLSLIERLDSSGRLVAE